jgi:hypothetical protein
MFDAALVWFQHWLALIQGFAALASIFGALLSWRFAFKAKKSREEMTSNIITSKLATALEEVVIYLDDLRPKLLSNDGSPDPAAYRNHAESNRRIFSKLLAQVKASEPYFTKKPNDWSRLLIELNHVCYKADAQAVNAAYQKITILLASLNIAATTREHAPQIL